jgi:hypothetical protein
VRFIDLTELHYITPIANLPSILARGILSRKLAARVPHESIANEEVQDRRAMVRVPNGCRLHEYVNLYFNARNPMMYVRQNQHRSLCIIRVSPDVVHLPDVVIADRNAARDWPRWEPSPAGLRMIDRDRVFAEWWTHPGDPDEQYRHKGEMCAEVLVPEKVPPDFITGAYVSGATSAAPARALVPSLPITVDGYLFFFTARRPDR